jgi:RimJ/RimL family protein N-acetyltransferase
MPEIELYPMTKKEFADYRAIALADNREDMTAGSWSTRAEAITRFGATFSEGLNTVGLTFLAIRTPTATVGFLIYQDAHRAESHECFILDLHVLQYARRRGYASTAIGLLRDTATSLGFDRIGLSVLPTNEAAERLYRRCGFEPAFTRFHLPLIA